MRKEIKNIIGKTDMNCASVNGVTDDILDLFYVMLSEQENVINKTYNDPLLKLHSKKRDRNNYKEYSLNVIKNLKHRLLS